MTDNFECLECGMEVPKRLTNCPKCDANLQGQNSGLILQLDIAHNAETIPVALGKLERAVEEAQQCRAQALRLVVGRGLIRDEVLRQLSWLQHSGRLLTYDYDDGNTGAILVTLRN
jgi:predicted ATP-dependent serine protease